VLWRLALKAVIIIVVVDPSEGTECRSYFVVFCRERRHAAAQNKTFDVIYVLL
jgi:hypothetical protein